MNSTEHWDQKLSSLNLARLVVLKLFHQTITVCRRRQIVRGGGPGVLFHQSQGVLKITVDVRDGVDGVVMVVWTNDSNGWHWG